MKPVVVTFGCPRSGTTFLYRCLRAMQRPAVYRLPDGSPLHPSKSPKGLVRVGDLFYDHDLTFVRIVRHPMDVVESFLALRVMHPEAARAQDNDERIVRWIVNEHKNATAQRDKVLSTDDGWGARTYIEVRYEDLRTADGRGRLVAELDATGCMSISDRTSVRAALDTFGRKPAGPGKLRGGIKRRVTTEAEAAWFREHLAETIKAADYQ